MVWQGDDATPPLVNDEVEIYGQMVVPPALQNFIEDQPFTRVPRPPVASEPREPAR